MSKSISPHSYRTARSTPHQKLLDASDREQEVIMQAYMSLGGVAVENLMRALLPCPESQPRVKYLAALFFLNKSEGIGLENYACYSAVIKWSQQPRKRLDEFLSTRKLNDDHSILDQILLDPRTTLKAREQVAEKLIDSGISSDIAFEWGVELFKLKDARDEGSILCSLRLLAYSGRELPENVKCFIGDLFANNPSLSFGWRVVGRMKELVRELFPQKK